MIIDITWGNGWTAREIGYTPDITLDKNPATNPTVVGDFRSLPFPNDYADMIVFDPPYSTGSLTGSFARDWGCFVNQADLRAQISQAFAEIARVLKPDGICLFKWGETDRNPPARILALLPETMQGEVLFEREPGCVSRYDRRRPAHGRVYWIQLFRTAIHAALDKEPKP